MLIRHGPSNRRGWLTSKGSNLDLPPPRQGVRLLNYSSTSLNRLKNSELRLSQPNCQRANRFSRSGAAPLGETRHSIISSTVVNRAAKIFFRPVGQTKLSSSTPPTYTMPAGPAHGGTRVMVLRLTPRHLLTIVRQRHLVYTGREFQRLCNLLPLILTRHHHDAHRHRPRTSLPVGCSLPLWGSMRKTTTLSLSWLAASR